MTEQPTVIEREQFTKQEVRKIGTKVGLIVLVIFFFVEFGLQLNQDYERVENLKKYFEEYPNTAKKLGFDPTEVHVDLFSVLKWTTVITFILGWFVIPGGIAGVLMIEKFTRSIKIISIGGFIVAILGAFLGHYLLALYLLWTILGT